MRRSGLNELDAVLAVSRRGSFRAAARELGMSTSAISATIAALESRLSVRLFHRTTRSVALTEAGQRYVERIAPAVAAIHDADDQIHSAPDAPAGTLRISAPPESTSIAMPVVETFLRRHPRMRLEIIAEARLIDIVADGFDAGIRLAESVPQDMVAIPLGPEMRLVVVGSPAYLAEHGTPRSPDDLSRHACIRLRMSHGGLYRWELERRGVAVQADPPGRLVLTEMRGVIAAAGAGLGLAFLSQWHVARELAEGALVRVLEDWCPPFPGLRLYYPGHRQVPPGLQALAQVAREQHKIDLAARRAHG